MADPIELQVVDNVISTLKAVSAQDPLYEIGIDSVEIGPLLETAFQGGKTIVGVYPGILLRESIKSMAGKHEAFNTFEVKIEAVTKGSTEDILQRASKLKGDIEIALFVDRRRGVTGHAIDTINIRHEPQPPHNDGTGFTLAFLTTLTVTWISFLGTP